MIKIRFFNYNHSYIVKFLKLLFPIIILIIIILTSIIYIISDKSKLDIHHTNTGKTLPKNTLSISNPLFYGVDEKYQKFNIQAKKIAYENDYISIISPIIQLNLQKQLFLFHANIGKINEKTKLITLNDNIKININNVYAINSDNVIFDTQKNIFHVTGQSSFIFSNNYIKSNENVEFDIKKLIGTFTGSFISKISFSSDLPSIHFSGNYLKFSSAENLILANNNINLKYDNIDLKADNLVANLANNNITQIILTNNIIINTPTDNIHTDKVIINFKEKKLITENFMYNKNNALIKGDQFTYDLQHRKGNITSQKNNAQIKIKIKND